MCRKRNQEEQLGKRGKQNLSLFTETFRINDFRMKKIQLSKEYRRIENKGKMNKSKKKIKKKKG